MNNELTNAYITRFAMVHHRRRIKLYHGIFSKGDTPNGYLDYLISISRSDTDPFKDGTGYLMTQTYTLRKPKKYQRIWASDIRIEGRGLVRLDPKTLISQGRYRPAP